MSQETSKEKDIFILGIESSCDDTSAAVVGKNCRLLSNIIASQKIHEEYGGVVPELASRAHQQNIVPVVDAALKHAGIEANQLSAIAFTRGPGLIGSLLVGTSFAKGLSLALQIPIIDVNHLHGHVLSQFIDTDGQTQKPKFPFLCLLISGGNSQIVLVRAVDDMTVVGQTIDDAAGEAFDKCAKIMGLPYPGGPHIDKLALMGNPHRFKFAKPKVPGYDYSFSGLKTSFLYTIRDHLKTDPLFVEDNKSDLAASLQHTIIEILMEKLVKAIKDYDIKTVVIGGGVSANSGVRKAVEEMGIKNGVKTFLPPKVFTTDNAAMIAVAGYYKYLKNDFCRYDEVPYARVQI